MTRSVFLLLLICSQVVAEDATTMVNEQRAKRGLGPLVYDEVLQLHAEQKAEKAARLCHKGHLGGSIYGATYEGIGYDRRKLFRACYLYTARTGSRIGAAIVRGRDGTFYSCLLLKSNVKLHPHNR